MAAVDGPLQPGTRLGGFLVLHALGSGGMGVVYAAQQERPRRTVAIKVLRRGFRHPEILRRFEHEAEMLGRLQHPGIAQVYAFMPGDRATPAHLVMELVAGPPMTDYARAQQLSIADRVGLIVKLAEAVQHAHDRGVIHRDLKPANVLVADGGQPKVLDFGIARATGADVQRITLQTAHGQLMGTLAYMSPEQLRGRSARGRRPQRRLRARRAALSAAGGAAAVRRQRRAVARGDSAAWLDATPTAVGQRDRLLAGPLEHVVARRWRATSGRRYQTAADSPPISRRFLGVARSRRLHCGSRHSGRRRAPSACIGRKTGASSSSTLGTPYGPGRRLAFSADGRLVRWDDGAMRLRSVPPRRP